MDPDGVIESNWDQVVTSFDDMNLKEELLRGIYAYGFEKPSAIQQRAILPCIRGKQAGRPDRIAWHSAPPLLPPTDRSQFLHSNKNELRTLFVSQTMS